jgi:medium-chain acyl-[acyl-carrier-protein] hydrolase
VAFFHWPKLLPPDVEVWAVSLPGRGARFQERPFSRLRDLLDALLPVLLPELQEPFAFFGHSMGALIAFETARRLCGMGAALPSQLVVSARPAPRFAARRAPIHELADEEFIEELRRFGGTPAEAMENDELMKLVLPVVRADFALVETYFYAKASPLPVPIWAFGGAEDERIPRELLAGWKEETCADFALELFPGGHFYLDSGQPALLARLGQILSDAKAKTGSD